MDFGDALKELRRGGRVARTGWNGKGMWLFFAPGYDFQNTPGQIFTNTAAKLVEVDHPARVVISGHIDMRAADGSLTIGWAPSQVDMLADDWCILEEADEG